MKESSQQTREKAEMDSPKASRKQCPFAYA